jgi:exonuclease III
MPLPMVLRLLILVQGGHVFHSAIAALLTNGYTDCYRALYRQRPGYTLPSNRPNARLDYLFANHVLAPSLRHCEVIMHPEAVRKASDHLPVVAEFG